MQVSRASILYESLVRLSWALVEILNTPLTLSTTQTDSNKTLTTSNVTKCEIYYQLLHTTAYIRYQQTTKKQPMTQKPRYLLGLRHVTS